MFQGIKKIGSGLLLVALLASAAQAETVMVNPGAAGTPPDPENNEPGEIKYAKDFIIDNETDTTTIDAMFSNSKVLDWGPGVELQQAIVLYGPHACEPWTGVLIGPDGLSGGAFNGKFAPCNSSDGVAAFVANTGQSDAIEGVRVVYSNGFTADGVYEWTWDNSLVDVEDPPPVWQITGNQAPLADPGGPYTGQPDVDIVFNGSDSSDKDGTIADPGGYSWTFGDGGTASGSTPIHAYSEAGSYNVCLEVTDNDGATSNICTTAKIGLAADAGGPYTADSNGIVSFSSSDSVGQINSWSWDFGDGAESTQPNPGHTYDNATGAEYPVTLTITDTSDQTDVDNTTATVPGSQSNQPPIADAGKPITGAVGEEITFDGSDSYDPDGDEIVQYDWLFGPGGEGGINDGGPNPTHVYDTPGFYNVTLSVSDGKTTDTDYTSAEILGDTIPPVAEANGPYNGDIGEPVSFDSTGSTDRDGVIESYIWFFGDGNSSVEESPTHTYETARNYEVELYVIDDEGNTSAPSTTSANIGFGDNEAPIADAGGPYGGTVFGPVSFDGSGSEDTDGEIEKYEWDFGDGSSAKGRKPTHTYREQGVYPVKLTITDDVGATDVNDTQAIIADGNIPPTADVGGPYRGQVGVAVQFDGSGSTDVDGSIDTYSWDFGDNNTAKGRKKEYEYSADGLYLVGLTVTDDDGATKSDTIYVRIGEASVPPVADAGGTYPASLGKLVQFDGSGSTDLDGTIDKYRWDFGDGDNGKGKTPKHVYTSFGIKIVKLTVTDDTGETDVNVTQVVVANGTLPPVADAGAPYNGEVGAPIRFDGSGSSGEIDSYRWDFGDGRFANGGKPTHTYDAAGYYAVTLSVTDESGLTDSDGTLAVVNVDPIPIREVLALADANGNSSPDVALVRRDDDLHYRAYVFDGATGESIRSIDLGTSTVTAAVVVDRAGAPDDIAALRLAPNGSWRALVVNSGSGETVNQVWFGTDFTGIDLAADDVDGDGSPDVGVLGENADGSARILFKDIETEATVVDFTQSNEFQARQLLTLPTVNGGSDVETATIAIKRSTNEAFARIADSGTGKLLSGLKYGKSYRQVTSAVIPDAGGPGLAGVAQLGVQSDPDGIRVRMRDAATAETLTTSTISNTRSAVDLSAISDLGGDGIADIATLIGSEDGTGRVLLYNGATGARIRAVDMPPIKAPADLAVSADINGNGADELVGLGKRNGVDRIVIFDSVTKAKLLRIDVP
jgi:PKD repeat protein